MYLLCNCSNGQLMELLLKTVAQIPSAQAIANPVGNPSDMNSSDLKIM